MRKPELKDALARLDANDLGGAVTRLLEAWRHTPDPRLAEVLDGLSTRSARPALTTATQQKTTDAFLELLDQQDPLDLPRLVAVIGTTRAALMVEQLEALLERWPADPRVTRPFVQLLQRPPFTGSSTQSAWRRLFKVLQQYADPRALELLAGLDFAALLREQNPWARGGVDEHAFAATFFTERAAAVVEALRKKYAKGLPRLPASDDAVVARLLERARPSPEVALISAVQAAPQEEGARAVLADALLEKNDVRGRFMALQQARTLGTLSPADEKEERALVSQFGLQWAGALAPLIKDDELSFERGFLSACTIDVDRDGLVKQLTGHAAWGTVREVHLWGTSLPLELLTDAAMKSLTGVTGIRDSRARALLEGERTFPSWTTVGLDLPHYDSVAADLKLLSDNVLRVFPALKELVLDGYSIAPTQYEWLWAPRFAHLTRIGVTGAGPGFLPGWLEVTRRAPPHAVLEVSRFHRDGFQWRLRPGPDGRRTVLELSTRAVSGHATVTLTDLVEASAALTGALTRVRVFTRSTKAERALLAKLLAPGGELETA